MDDLVKFIRRRDYRTVRELSRGGCGRTILLHDDMIDQYFVCKKYDPRDPDRREELYGNFMSEIRLMHQVFHPNVVRIFNYYVYPDRNVGYIIMEYVEGDTIANYLASSPEHLLSIFSQTINAFCHLEKCGILHRDLRDQNILVSKEGVVKVIDLGFGKQVKNDEDFRKSITLNWPFTPPMEFASDVYDFSTEVYFVGKLFDRIISANDLQSDRVQEIVTKMTAERAALRYSNFREVEQALSKAAFDVLELSEEVVEVYREFVNEAIYCIAGLRVRTVYEDDEKKIIRDLERVYEASMLEDEVRGERVVRCLLNGAFNHYPDHRITVAKLRDFLKMFKGGSEKTRRIVLANLHHRLDGVKRIDAAPKRLDDEIPF